MFESTAQGMDARGDLTSELYGNGVSATRLHDQATGRLDDLFVCPGANGASTSTLEYANSTAGPYDVSLSQRFGSPNQAAIAFGRTFGREGIHRKIEYNAAIVELLPVDAIGPPAYAFTNPIPGEVGATTVDMAAYEAAVIQAYGEAHYVALAHNHLDRNLKFSGLDADTGVALRKPLYLYNRDGQTRLLDSSGIKRERGSMRLDRYVLRNRGLNGRCINGC